MDSSPREIKKQLRADALARRDALDPEWRIEMSLRMADAAQAIDVAPGEVVSGFWPMRSEVDVRPLMFALRDKGTTLCLPAILDRTTIVFRELTRGGTMIDMGFGTMGPDETAAVLEPSLMLVPLAAFDRRGHRIGYGAGYYDRAIARRQASGEPVRLIGVAFDCQEVERVPDEAHDVVIPEMLTESGLHRFAGRAPSPGRHLVFAFGTLKRGFPLHEKGLADATFLGEARTAERYPMLVAGPWFAPMLFNQPGEGVRIRGELYEIDEQSLARLDEMESVGKPGNFRATIAVEWTERGEICEAQVYVKSPELAAPVHTGYLEDYQDRRFVPPWLRKAEQ